MTFLLDTREPWPHPWTAYLPAGSRLVRGTLDTGDLDLTEGTVGREGLSSTPTRGRFPDFKSEVSDATTRDFRAMPAVVFHRGHLFREERAALAARPRFYSMPWLRLVTHDGTRDDDLPA